MTLNQIDHILIEGRRGTDTEDIRSLEGADCNMEPLFGVHKVKAQNIKYI
jgi:hypothetical protein